MWDFARDPGARGKKSSGKTGEIPMIFNFDDGSENFTILCKM